MVPGVSLLLVLVILALEVQDFWPSCRQDGHGQHNEQCLRKKRIAFTISRIFTRDISKLQKDPISLDFFFCTV